MKIIAEKQELFDKGVANNQDPYGKCCYDYLVAWADEMEKCMAAGETLEQCAKRTSTEVDSRDGFGITGFMYGCAVSVLAACWEHGEALRVWHNLATQLGTEGEQANARGGVLNPAILNIG